MTAKSGYRLFFEDVELCESGGSDKWANEQTPETIIKKPETPEFVKLYPNPAQHTLKLYFKAETEGSVSFELANSLGQVVFNTAVPDNGNVVPLDISMIDSGIYYWRLRDATRIISSGTQSVVK